MAVGFRAATYASRPSSSTTPLSVPVPAGTAAGDLMLLAATRYGSGEIDTPSGWTVVHTNVHLDGQVVARSVNTHNARGAHRTASQTSGLR